MRRRLATFRLSRWVALGAAAAVACLAAALADHRGLAVAEEPPTDPIPIQRIALPSQQIPAEMERVRQKVLAQLSRADFEARVQKAAKAVDAQRSPPRLVEAHYRAALAGDDLAGSAVWKIIHNAGVPGRLPLNALQLGLRDARWRDKQPAVLGFLDERADAPLELLVEPRGERELIVEWSARGLADPEGLRFDLRLPASPITILDLDLPEKHTPQTDRETCLITGPFAAPVAGRQSWRLVVAGAASNQTDGIPLRVQRSAGPGQPAPLLRPLFHNTQRLMPEQVECDFDIDLLIQRGSVRELRFECDPGLRPVEVLIPGQDRWEVTGDAQSGTQLAVPLREPFAGGRVLVRAVMSPPGPDTPWRSPGLRVVGGLSRGETLALRVHPDLQLEKWKLGGFRWVDALTAADRAQVLTLQSVLGATIRPAASIRQLGPVFNVKQTLEWQLETERSSVNANFQIDVQRGVLPALRLGIPEGWEIENIEATPADPLLRWSALPGALDVLVEPSQPWAPASESANAARLSVRMRHRESASGAASRSLAFPDLLPSGAARREGTLTVMADPLLAFTVETALPQIRPGVFVFRGPRVEGTLRLRPQPLKLQARCLSESTYLAGRLRTRYRLSLKPAAEGGGREFELFVSAPIRGSWDFQTLQGVAEVQSILPIAEIEAPVLVAALGCVEPLSTAGILNGGYMRGGRRWRLTLDRPLTQTLELELSCETPAGEQQLRIPLLCVAHADPMIGLASVNYPADSAWKPDGRGVQEVTAIDLGTRPSVALTRRTYQYALPPVDLVLNRRPRRAELDQSGAASLLVFPTIDGRLLNRFRLSASGWGEPVLPVRLPAGATLITTHVDGHQALLQPAADGTVRVPWPVGEAWPSVELTYALPGSTARLATSYDAPAPELPFPLPIRRVWRLPYGLTPLVGSTWTILPGGTHVDASAGVFSRLRQAGWSEGRQQSLAEMARAMPPIGRLGEALAHLAHDPQSEAGPLIVDVGALRDRGITPATTLAPAGREQPFWEVAGLVLLSSPTAALLTTRDRAISWNGVVPVQVADAIMEAVAAGADRSGRYRIVTEWLASARVQAASSLPLGDSEVGWSDWEAPAGQGQALWAVRSQVVTTVGVVLALLWLVAGAAGSVRGWRWTGPCLVAGPGAAALAWLWLPAQLQPLVLWPLGASLVALVVVAVARRRRSANTMPTEPSGSKPSRPAVVASFAGVLMLSLVWTGVAAGPDPVPVYLVPGPGGDAAAGLVLAPPVLLDQLQALAQRGAPTADAVVLATRLEGRAAAAFAHFDADLSIHSFRAGRTSVTIPLSGVLLREAQLDGKRTFPRQAEAGNRYTFEVAGSGVHTLKLAFDVPISGNADRDLRFSVPELPLTRLAFQVPPGATQVQTLPRRGAQQLSPTPTGVRIEADLGRVGVVHVRWREPGPEPPQRTKVQELNLWDLSESTARLRCAYRFRLGPVQTTDLELTVPAELELADASAQLVDEGIGFGSVIGLRQWQESAPDRVRLQFQAALSGQAVVTLELAPKQSPGMQPVLPLPTLVGDFERERLVAVRVRDWDASVLEARGLAPYPRDAFREIWQALRLDTTPRPIDFAFRCESGAAPALRVGLQQPRLTAIGQQHVAWLVGPGRADVRATATWSGVSAAGLVEWDIPVEVAITELRGRELRSWSRHGSRVQAWLDRAVDAPADRTIVLEMTGSMPLPAASGAEKIAASLPPFALVSVASQAVAMQVSARDGWRFLVTNAGKYRQLPETDLSAYQWRGHADDSTDRMAVELRPAGGLAEVQQLTVLQAAGGQFDFATTLDVRAAAAPAAGFPTSIHVELQHFAGAAVKWQLPAGCHLRETRTNSDGGSWIIDVPPGQHRLVVSGETRLAIRRPEIPCPHVTARTLGPTPRGGPRWLAIIGEDVAPADVGNLLGVESATVGRFLDEERRTQLQQMGRAWSVAGPLPPLHLRSGHLGDVERRSISVPAEITAAVAADGAWLLEGRFTIASDGLTPWVVRPAAAGRILDVTVDGQSVPVEETAAASVNVEVFPARAGLHILRVIWAPPPTADQRLSYPLPRLENGGVDVRIGPTFWTVRVPPGRRLRPKGVAPLSPVVFDLQRAAALIELGRASKQPEKESAVGARVERLLQRASYRLHNSTGIFAGDAGPGDQSLADWLAALRAAAGAPARSAESAGLDSSEQLAFGNTMQRGRPYHWRTEDTSPPPFRLEPDDESVARLALTGVLALALLLGIVWGRRLVADAPAAGA